MRSSSINSNAVHLTIFNLDFFSRFKVSIQFSNPWIENWNIFKNVTNDLAIKILISRQNNLGMNYSYHLFPKIISPSKPTQVKVNRHHLELIGLPLVSLLLFSLIALFFLISGYQLFFYRAKFFRQSLPQRRVLGIFHRTLSGLARKVFYCKFDLNYRCQSVQPSNLQISSMIDVMHQSLIITHSITSSTSKSTSSQLHQFQHQLQGHLRWLHRTPLRDLS